MQALQTVAYGSVVSTYILIMIGGYVSASGSGDACPDWPLCNGQWVPPLEGSILVEYTHRIFTLVVATFVFGTALLAWKRARDEKMVLLLSTASSVFLLGQIALGMVTVTSRLDPRVVASHLALASGVFGLLVVNAMLIRNLRPRTTDVKLA